MNWPCEANNQGPFVVEASPVHTSIDHDWPLCPSYRVELLERIRKSSSIVSDCERVALVPELQGEWSSTLTQHIARFKRILQLLEQGHTGIPWFTHFNIDRHYWEELNSLPSCMITTMAIMNRNRCRTCNSVTNVKKCSGCQLSCYCSKECQRKDWQDHKSLCVLLKTQ